MFLELQPRPRQETGNLFIGKSQTPMGVALAQFFHVMGRKIHDHEPCSRRHDAARLLNGALRVIKKMQDLMQAHEIGKTIGNGTIVGANVVEADVLAPSDIYPIEVTGKLTLAETSQLVIVLTPNGYPSILNHGIVDLHGKLVLQLRAGYVPSFYDNFTIISSGTALTGLFSNVVSGERLLTSDGQSSFQVDYAPNVPGPGFRQVVLRNFIVPEPSSTSLMLLAVPLLLSRRKRQAE